MAKVMRVRAGAVLSAIGIAEAAAGEGGFVEGRIACLDPVGVRDIRSSVRYPGRSGRSASRCRFRPGWCSRRSIPPAPEGRWRWSAVIVIVVASKAAGGEAKLIGSGDGGLRSGDSGVSCGARIFWLLS